MAEIRAPFPLEIVLYKVFVFVDELLYLEVVEELVGEAAVITLIAEASRMYPLAGKHLGLMAVLALALTSLAIVLHEVFAQIELKVVR